VPVKSLLAPLIIQTHLRRRGPPGNDAVARAEHGSQLCHGSKGIRGRRRRRRRRRAGADGPDPGRLQEAEAAGFALAPAPHGFTVGDFAAKVHAITGTSDAEYSIRQAAYNLRKLRGKQLVDKPARTHRYRVPALAARTIAALLTLRDQVIAPILAAVRSPRMGRKPAHWTRVNRDYERIRIDIQTLFNDLDIETPLAA
jgi:hypothetical protein